MTDRNCVVVLSMAERFVRALKHARREQVQEHACGQKAAQAAINGPHSNQCNGCFGGQRAVGITRLTDD